ncbi:MAG: HEPN domain-containing protein [Deltaproteobacteria bacterium]|nr:HEPN domain-containing protein [Deltaproteobacteria bacterium]
MKNEIKGIIQKAERSLKVALGLFAENDFDFAVSRAYYSMFYMAEAVLLTKGLSFSKHSGVISGFNQHFIKTGIFEYKYYEMLRFAFEQRNIGDYRFLQQVSKETAQRVVNEARQFLEETKEYLKSFTNG